MPLDVCVIEFFNVLLGVSVPLGVAKPYGDAELLTVAACDALCVAVGLRVLDKDGVLETELVTDTEGV